jgi:hypothetical protein
VLRKPALLVGGRAAQAESQAFLPQQGVAPVPRSKTVKHKRTMLKITFLTSAKYERGARKKMLLDRMKQSKNSLNPFSYS